MAKIEQKVLPLNGDEAVALAAKQSDVDVVAAYPITCRSRGPCDDHPERGNACHGAQGLTYVVTSGELAGVWHAWGDGAAGRIFEQMCTRVNELWQDRFDDVTRFSAALRGVSR